MVYAREPSSDIGFRGVYAGAFAGCFGIFFSVMDVVPHRRKRLCRCVAGVVGCVSVGSSRASTDFDVFGLYGRGDVCRVAAVFWALSGGRYEY